MDKTTRYSRQMAMPEIGIVGQERLKTAKVLIVGAGGLGSPVALYLAAAGVGTLGIVDYDIVSTTNLNRQILYNENNVGELKVDIAAQRLKELNSNVNIITYTEKLTHENYNRAVEIISQYDIIVDACDNMPTRFLVSDIADELSLPFVYGAMEGFCGYISVFNDKSNYKRFRNLWQEETMDTKHNIPALGATAGVIGSTQACEVIKWICGFGDRLAGKLLTINLLTMNFHAIEL